MSEHLRRETLEGFLLNRLPSHEVKVTIAHLLGGCVRCQEEISPYATAMFSPETAPACQLSAAEDEAYERAISAAFDRAIEQKQTLEAERETAERRAEEMLRAARQSETPSLPERIASWGLCESLLEKSYSLRHSDRRGMLKLANLARFATDRLDPRIHGEERRADMQSRAWAELSNAYRLNDDFPQAEAAMACAQDLRNRGTGDPLLYARLAELNASLLSDRRRFKESFRMLDLAYSIHRRHSGPHEVGRVLILKGAYTGMAGRPEEGVQLLVRGLSMIDRERDSKLAFQTLHNILSFRVDLGQYEEARRQLQRMRSLYVIYATGLDLMKLHWIEGKIAAGLSDLVTAEATFQQIRQDLDEAGFGYEAALVSLDLAGVWLVQGRTASVHGLVTEMVAAFRALGVEREAMSALHMLQEALRQDQATLEVLRLVSGILRRLQNEPTARAGLGVV